LLVSECANNSHSDRKSKNKKRSPTVAIGSYEAVLNALGGMDKEFVYENWSGPVSNKIGFLFRWR